MKPIPLHKKIIFTLYNFPIIFLLNIVMAIIFVPKVLREQKEVPEELELDFALAVRKEIDRITPSDFKIFILSTCCYIIILLKALL